MRRSYRTCWRCFWGIQDFWEISLTVPGGKECSHIDTECPKGKRMEHWPATGFAAPDGGCDHAEFREKSHFTAFQLF